VTLAHSFPRDSKRSALKGLYLERVADRRNGEGWSGGPARDYLPQREVLTAIGRVRLQVRKVRDHSQVMVLVIGSTNWDISAFFPIEDGVRESKHERRTNTNI
jgi:hypothetical protein